MYIMLSHASITCNFIEIIHVIEITLHQYITKVMSI